MMKLFPRQFFVNNLQELCDFNGRADEAGIQKNGLWFSTCFQAMCCDFGGNVYLMRENERNEGFYKKLGFENTGKWRIYK